MLSTISPAVVQLAMPAIRQGARDAIRLGSACVTLYAGVAAVALVGYGAYFGGTRAYRGTRQAYTWASKQARSVPPIALPATAPVVEPSPAA
jgi:hypothetical protein